MSNKPEIKKTKYHKAVDIISIVLIIATFIFVIVKFSSMPDRIPMHYDSAGNVDSYGSRGEVWLFPIFSVVMFLILTVVEKVPGEWNTGVKVTPENSTRVYKTLADMLKTLKLSIMIMFTYFSVNATMAGTMPGWVMTVSILAVILPIIYFTIKLARESKMKR